MISWHKVGQHVVCINAGAVADSHNLRTGILTEGALYTIAEVAECVSPAGDLRIGFKLLELPQAAEYWSCARRFQPVYPHALERLRDLCAPTLEQKRPFFEEMIDERVDAWRRENAR